MGTVALFAVVACDASFAPGGRSRICLEAATQCQLAEGPLGVCERISCPAGDDPPCFACISQH